jgi:Cdc6-like AAA superfamily ATPase
LKDEKITAWIKGSTYQHLEVPEQEQPVSQIKKLFLYGFSGCGRTTLTASVIEHLISTECTEQQGVCYYFCNRFHQGTEDPHNVLKTLISQLVRQNESAFAVLDDHLNTRKVPPECINSHSYSLEDLETLLGSIIRRFERVFAIINSVEVLLPDNAARLLSLLAGLSDSSETNVSLLSTGAEQPGQRELSQALNFCPVYVQGRPDDIRVYVRAELNRRIEQGDSELKQNHFQTTIENYIAERSNGA